MNLNLFRLVLVSFQRFDGWLLFNNVDGCNSVTLFMCVFCSGVGLVVCYI